MSEPQGHAATAVETNVIKKTGWADAGWGKVVLLVIGASLALSGQYVFSVYNNQMRFIEYQVTPVASVIQRPDLGGKELKVTIDGRPVDNLSTMTLAAWNNSGKNYKDATLNIAFKSADGKPFEMIRETVSPDLAIDAQMPTTSPATGLSLRRTYQFKFLNQIVDNVPLLGAQYVFTGSTPPEVTVDVQGEGLATKRVAVAEARGNREMRWWETATFYTAPLGLFLWVMIWRDERKAANRLRIEVAELKALNMGLEQPVRH